MYFCWWSPGLVCIPSRLCLWQPLWKSSGNFYTSATHALASSFPINSLFGAEFSALVTDLSNVQLHEPRAVHLFGDNQAVIDLFNLAQGNTCICAHPRDSKLKFIK